MGRRRCTIGTLEPFFRVKRTEVKGIDFLPLSLSWTESPNTLVISCSKTIRASCHRQYVIRELQKDGGGKVPVKVTHFRQNFDNSKTSLRYVPYGATDLSDLGSLIERQIPQSMSRRLVRDPKNPLLNEG